MTLIEITVVILVLLSLISVLFIGVQAYQNGVKRSQCIMNIRNIQTHTRTSQNMANKSPGDAVGSTLSVLLVTGGFFPAAPTCPRDNTAYDLTGTTYPAVSSLAAPCPDILTYTDHVPDSIVGW